jgi:isoquinoline 1-oxidoreductase beta subunit
MMETTRRNALKVFGIGGAFAVAAPAFLGSTKAHAETADNLFAGKLGPFVQINSDNTVTIGAPIPDMGTGVETALPMMVAEQLDVRWQDVRVERMSQAARMHSDGELYNLYVAQGSGGSGSIRRTWPVMRDCGALARHMLVKAAAETWSVAATSLTTVDGHVRHAASGRRISYADLVGSALALDMDGVQLEVVKGDDPQFDVKVPAESAGGARRKPVAEHKIVGTAIAQENIERLVRGEEKYGIDMDIEGQQVAVIERCPYFDGDVASFDGAAALAVPGVTKVVKVPRLPGDSNEVSLDESNSPGVAVIATSLWAAQKGREKLVIQWDMGPNTQESDAWREAECAEAVTREEASVQYEVGDFRAAYEGAARKLKSVYTAPHFSHMTMEPISCAASVSADRCIVSTSHQFPDLAARVATRFSGLDYENIEVRVGRIGCGFGRKYYVDFVVEALFLSREAGTPVKVYWTREDDVQHDMLNPSAHYEMQAGLSDDGQFTAWRGFSVARWRPQLHGFPCHLVPNAEVAYVRPKGRAPLGAWRGPGNNTSGFAVGSFMDEIAHELGQDPLEFLLTLLGEPKEYPFGGWMPRKEGTGIHSGKMAGVLKLAAEKADWGKATATGWGRGIAGHFTFGSYAAFVVDVSYEEGRGLKVERVVGAGDCGMVVNLHGAKAQMESGVHDGLSTVLYQHTRIEGGRITSTNFDEMPLLRMDEAPREMEIHFIDSKTEPYGLGEVALPAFMPALMNAIFDATGKRIRNLPLGDQLSA